MPQVFPPDLRRISPADTIIGAPGGALRNIITNRLADGAVCWVTAEQVDYRLLRGSTAAPDNFNIVQPIAGPGRWFREGSGGGAGGTFWIENENDIASLTVPAPPGPPPNVAFPWDRAPIITGGDWALTGALPSSTVACVRAGRYEVRYTLAFSSLAAEPAAYVAGVAELDGAEQPGSLCQFNIGSEQAATFNMSFPLLAVSAGQVLVVKLVAAPEVDITVGAGASLKIVRL